MKRLLTISFAGVLAVCLPALKADNEQPVSKWLVGGTASIADNTGFVWNPIPCPTGSLAYIVQPVNNLPHPQFAGACYSPKSITFSLPVITGNYIVKLSFIDPSATAVNQRLFTVSINDDIYKTNFDLFKARGANMSEIIIGYPIIAPEGVIKITLVANRWNALLSGIEISAFSAPILVYVPALPIALFKHSPSNLLMLRALGESVVGVNESDVLPSTGWAQIK